MSKSEPSYQPNVAGILRNRDGKILICERVTIPGAWQFPQGGVDDGETVEQALVRELCEEISIEAGDFRIVEKRDGYRYLFPGGKKRGHDGKDQTYFLCDFLADDSAINVKTEHPEFRTWKWIAPSDFRREWLPTMKADVYAAVFRDFFGIRL
jgi:putative (di)nucleoside polyphosphate hydrolase